MSVSITYRKLSSTGDPVWGQGTANFLSNLQAVAQAVLTRLRLFQGEWWAATNDGLPLWQSILGQNASQQSQEQISILISARIVGTPFVIGITNLQTGFNPVTRAYTYYAVINTQFGQMVISNFPTPA